MTRLRVAHVITKLELGGAQQNTLYTISNLNRSLFDPQLICGSGGFLDETVLKFSDVGIHFCPSLVRPVSPKEDWHAYRRLKHLFQRLGPDIVHTHSSKAGILGRLAAHEAKVPIIIHTYHGFGFHPHQNFVTFRAYVAAERVVCRRTHHLIFVSEDNRRWANRLGLIGNNSVSLIRSGVETSAFRACRNGESLRAKFGIPEDCNLVGMVACLKPQKDPLTFVAVADAVTRELGGVYFLLIGDGELRGAVEKRISKMKHPERFIFAGWNVNIPEVFAALNLFVLTSRWEGLPRVLPEATLAGVPAIASDIDGNREAIYEGRNGALARPGDVADFAAKIICALNEKWTVDSLIAEKVGTEFDIDTMVRQQEQLYLELASAVLV